MRITAKIGTCVIEVEDGNASEPASVRWGDQYERIKELITETQKAVVLLHQQQVSDT